MRQRGAAGYSLIELLVTIGVMGVVVAMSVPAYRSYMNASALKGSTQIVQGNLNLARVRALATGQPVSVSLARQGAERVRLLVVGDGLASSRLLPLGVSMPAGSDSVVALDGSGRSSTSRTLVLSDRRGTRDTLSVELSGLVFVH